MENKNHNSEKVQYYDIQENSILYNNPHLRVKLQIKANRISSRKPIHFSCENEKVIV